MVWERIPSSEWQQQSGHIYRYKMAAELIRDGQTVIDAACGIGYGASVLTEGKDITYFGVDRHDDIDQQFLPHGWFSAQDLNTWQPDFEFDVAVCFETLEHLADYRNMVNWLKRAKCFVILSVPTVPTKHMNEFHLHDFTVDDIVALFDDAAHIDITPQPDELSHIFVITL
jgi:2-polyprenyl-3-methyl-5-hydroxy-6-metoxy-1,4-benzoquinol methylase